MSRTNHFGRARRLRLGAPGTPRMTRDRDYVSPSAPPANVGDPGAFAAWALYRYPTERKVRRRAAEQKVRGRRKDRLARDRAARGILD